MNSNSWRLLRLVASLALAAAISACGDQDRPAGPPPSIAALSSDADHVSGGDVLVDVAPGTAGQAVTVSLNGADVSAVFHADPNNAGHSLGVVAGIRDGANKLVAKSNGVTATLNVTGYPITGPIISGPHQTPYICQTSTFLLPDGNVLGDPTDADCSIAPVVTYMYLQAGGSALVPLPSTTSLPADIASTTTTDGKVLPFVVRVETATVDRGIFQSAVLHDPTTESGPTPVAPPKGWNRRLIADEGFACPGGWYIQGGAQGNFQVAGFNFILLNPQRLGEGYAIFTNTLQHGTNNCNVLLASEAAMMSKEHFVKTYGAPVFTVSAGCSGGSYGSSQPADRIPGLFDGVLVACVFPDTLASGLSASDGHLLTHYWAVTDPSGFTDAQQAAVSGYKSTGALLTAAAQAQRTDPVPGRVDVAGYTSAVWNAVVPVGLRYDPVSNPTGARPTLYDASRNIYGVDPATGFALRVFDNVGVQYGLAALNAGTITTTQFLDLNEHIGGYDSDNNYVASRTVADAGAVTRAQQSGLQEGGNAGLAQIPVFDVTGIYGEDSGYHFQWEHFAMRERMLQANGDVKNYVMWRGNPVPPDQAWSAFIAWVAAYKADTAAGTQRDKVLRDRPATLVDGCWSDASTFVAEDQTLSSTADTTCNGLYPSWTFPRQVAGGPVAANILQCTLKPVAAADYAVTFSAAELARLKTIFPAGVCDWSRQGQHQTLTVPNGSFGPSKVNLLYDITAGS